MRRFINAEPAFDRHGVVIDAASELALKLFGEGGRHARSSLDVASLPAQALVEIELTAASI
jgi:enamine deaminase RidA (YjgF/YER057c/UK114 family)